MTASTTPTTRPTPPPVDPEGIPEALKRLPSWVCWRYVLRDGTWTKPPVDPKTGRPAKVDKLSTWGTFAEAIDAYRRSQGTSNPLDGVGIVLQEGYGIVGLDFDKCSNDAGIEAWAYGAVRGLGSYAEVSPSGHGLRVFVVGNKSRSECRRGRFECYNSARYVTLTGHRIPEAPATIEHRQEALDALLNDVFEGRLLPEDIAKRAASEAKSKPLSTGGRSNLRGFKVSPAPAALSDQEVLDHAMRAANGASFERLWKGDTSAHGGDASAADLALCNALVFWTGRDAAQTDRLFRSSGLMRAKWDERRGGRGTYGERTIQKAIEDCQTVYQGAGKTNSEHQAEFRAYSEHPQEEREKADESLSSDNFEYSEHKKHGPAYSELSWGEVTPLEAPAPPSPPVEAIPRWLGEHAESVARATETPLDLAVVAGLGALSAAAAGWMDISPAYGWREPTNLYLLASYPSGGGKSPVWRSMHRPIERADIAAHQAWVKGQFERAAEVSQLEQEVKDAEARIKAALRGGQDEDVAFYRDRVAQLLERIARLQAPPARRTTEDCTPEGLLRLMAGNGGILGVLSAEGHLFTQLAGLYSAGTPNLNLALKAHSGDTLLSDRAGRAPLIIERPLLSLCLGVQPGVLQEAGANRAFRGTGFLARFLFSVPASNVGFRSLSLSPVDSEAEERYQAALERIVARVPRLQVPAFAQAVHGATLLLTEDAREAFLSYRRGIEKERAPGGFFSGFSDWAAKLDGHMLRIAALLHIADYAFEDTIPQLVEADTIHRAYLLISYFIQHARAAFIGMIPDARMEGARKVLAWLRRQGKRAVPKRAIQQAMRGTFASLEEFEPAISLLVEHGFVQYTLPTKTGGPGRAPSPTVHVHPDVWGSDAQNQTSHPQNPSSKYSKFAESKHSSAPEAVFSKCSKFPGNAQNTQNADAGLGGGGGGPPRKADGIEVFETPLTPDAPNNFEYVADAQNSPDAQNVLDAQNVPTGNRVVDGLRARGRTVVPIRDAVSSPPVEIEPEEPEAEPSWWRAEQDALAFEPFEGVES